MRSAAAILGLAACAVATAGVGAQGVPAQQGERAVDGSYSFASAWMTTFDRDDYRETHLIGGFRFSAPGLGLEVRGASALMLSDLEGIRALTEQKDQAGLPVRGIEPPAPRRRLSVEQIRNRLDRTLRAVGSGDVVPRERQIEERFDLLRYLYFEGDVVVVRDGIEVLRCSRMWISPLDDRIVVEECEVRYQTEGREPKPLLVVRGDRLVKQGPRWTGRDLTITSCTAAEPHMALAAGEAEIIEREGEFEVIVRGQTLQVGGTSVLPLPDARIFTKSQSEFPIKRASGSYSEKLGLQGEVVFGLPWNRTGGLAHEWLTGRPAHEFRGDWEAGIGWIEARGVPLDGELRYRANGLYDGRLRGFWLDDRGDDLREIQGNLDGSPRDNESRGLVRSENRVYLGPATHVDLVAFQASDPGVLSEFFPGAYRGEEVPETSVYLHHENGNRLLTVGGRWNLDDFAYRDNRALADRFVEELPVVTWHWLAQPLGETPWRTPIVVDLATELGQRRSAYDDRSTMRVSDRTFRADQLVEVSAPFAMGPINLRPYASGRGTWYDESVAGGSEGRLAFEAGVQAGTRLSRTWRWTDEEGEHAVRHVIAPKVSYRNRYRVDEQPGAFFQFDATDALREQELVRVEVRNLLQRMVAAADGPSQPRDFVLLDLAQDFWPEAIRDNGGESIGLLYYDLLLRPHVPWLPVDDFAFAFYGDYDWRDGMRTLDTELRIGRIAGVTWTVDYREDRVAEGAVGVSGTARLFDRWSLSAGSQRDLDRDEWLSYSFNLVREDHDWSIAMSAGYNPFSDETTFRLEFLPRLFGGNRSRRERLGGAPLDSSDFATAY